jgi:hypothetical protein
VEEQEEEQLKEGSGSAGHKELYQNKMMSGSKT